MENKFHIRILQAGLWASLFFFGLTSCGSDGKVIATVDDSELTESEAMILMKHLGYDINNEAEYNAFIIQWCERETLKKELQETNPELYQLVQLRGDAFEGELAQFYLEEELLKGNLDTNVTYDQIASYYTLNKEDFILSDYLVKALYLKIPKDVEFKSEGIDQAFMLKNDKDLSQVNSYAKLYAENFYFNDSSWIYFNELSKDIPLTKYNVDNIVLNRTKTYFSDDEHTYFLNIIDFTLKDEIPPMEFVANQIKEIIVLNRLQDLKEQYGSTMIRKIKDKHEINISK
ncbi:MAG: hypothetical protein HWE22_01975 [Flavobacteriales bacterium]|nr:hypothetical protein [Flavobacteriales bacterium]